MKSFYANKVCSTDKVPTAARLAPEEFFSLSSTQEFVFSSLNTSNSLQHITAMSDWFYCYYFGFLFDNSFDVNHAGKRKSDLCLSKS